MLSGLPVLGRMDKDGWFILVHPADPMEAGMDFWDHNWWATTQLSAVSNCNLPLQSWPVVLGEYHSYSQHDECIYIYTHTYIWVNYNDLTATSLEIMVSKGNYPQMALIQVSEIL